MKEKLARKLARRNVPIRQVAVLPFRHSEPHAVEVMLLTSRQTSRFVIPKGWPMKGMPDWKAAALEARQEAGLIGNVSDKPIGTYQYWKRMKAIFVPVTVSVYAMAVRKEKRVWREMGDRQKRWLNVEDASSLVDEPDLLGLIQDFGRRLKADSGLGETGMDGQRPREG